MARRSEARKRRSVLPGAIESLERRLLLTVFLSPQEQLLLELINRARRDPQAEAARFGLSVEQSGFRAPVAPNQLLTDAARAHSQDMLDRDFFDHTKPDGLSSFQRVSQAGYPANIVGENIAWIGTTGSVNLNAFTVQMHQNLFKSPGHRAGMLDTRMLEVGVGLRVGEFINPQDGRHWNALIGTEVFASRSSGFFITGVAFTDGLVDDAFYTIGEELAGVTVTAQNQSSGATFTTTTGPSGGYSLEVPNGTYTVTFSGGGLPGSSVQQNITVSDQNRKVDFDQSNQRAATLPERILVSGADTGGGPHVRVFDAETGDEWLGFMAYHPSFRGGVRVATGDVNGDDVLDIITAPGPGGGPHIRVFDGRTGGVLSEFFAYHPQFAGGVFVAAGDVDGDGRADIITGAGAGGGPHVRVFSGWNLEVLTEFFAYAPQFLGGVHVAAGNVDGSGFADIITAAGPGGGPHVRVFDGQTGQPLTGPAASFFAYVPAFTGGVWVASADVNSDGRSDIITGAGPGGGPHVRVIDAGTGTQLNSFFAYAATFAGGVRVGSSDVDDNDRPDILTAPGPGNSPNIRAFDGLSPVLLAEGASNINAYIPAFTAGVYVAGGRNQVLNLTQTAGDLRTDFVLGETLSSVMIPRQETVPLPRPAIHPDLAAGVSPVAQDRREEEVLAIVDFLPTGLEYHRETDDFGLSAGESFDELFADRLLLEGVLSL